MGTRTRDTSFRPNQPEDDGWRRRNGVTHSQDIALYGFNCESRMLDTLVVAAVAHGCTLIVRKLALFRLANRWLRGQEHPDMAETN